MRWNIKFLLEFYSLPNFANFAYMVFNLATEKKKEEKIVATFNFWVSFVFFWKVQANKIKN